MVKLAIGGVLLALAAVFVIRYITGGGGGFNPREAATDITIECGETGETWTVVRGQLMDSLYSRGYPIDPEVGVGSPHADGRPVAFPQDRRLWREMVEKANTELKAYTADP